MSRLELDIRRMRRADLEIALEWAAGEGWNPGRHDADCFARPDPDGLLIGCLRGQPVASIACPRYGPRFGFVGLYLVRPDLRGRGLGMSLWRAGHRHLAGRTVGLDAVDAQVANYERSGYRVESHTHRHLGRGPAGAPLPGLLEIGEVAWDEVLAVDARGFPATRAEFLREWTAQPGTRALALSRDGAVAGFGVRRRCRDGYKVGPLFAPDRAGADALLDGLVDGLRPGEPWWIDTPATNPRALDLAADRGLERTFRTARMYRGEPPAYERECVFGVTTLELG